MTFLAARSDAVPRVDAVAADRPAADAAALAALRDGAAVSEDGQVSFDDFAAIDIRVGRIVEVRGLPGGAPAGMEADASTSVPEFGVKRSSAQVRNYAREELEGRLVLGVVNFPPRQIGPVRSEVLVLGTYSAEGVLLLSPEPHAKLGDRVG